MKFLIQRVKEVQVFSQGKEVENLTDGFLIFVGIEKKDLANDLSKVSHELLHSQIMEKDGKFRLTLKEANLPIIFISQITLTAGFVKGRINFDQSPKFAVAKVIYERLISEIKKNYQYTKSTPFGSYLLIKNINLGPVNFLIEL